MTSDFLHQFVGEGSVGFTGRSKRIKKGKKYKPGDILSKLKSPQIVANATFCPAFVVFSRNKLNSDWASVIKGAIRSSSAWYATLCKLAMYPTFE